MSPRARLPEPRRLLSRRVLYLLILPTEQCQLRCSYCYQAFEQGRMREVVVRALERWIARRADDLRVLILEWFGGEPLLAAGIVERVQAFASTLTRDRPHLAIRGMMTTNAVLLDPGRLRRLTAAGVRTYQIALDGPPEVHDRLRTTANGRGTFEQIWSNLLAARTSPLDFEIHLRLHVSADNAEPLRAFMPRLREAFGGDDRFRIALRPLHEPGLRTNRCAAVLEGNECRRALNELSDLAERLGLVLHPEPYGGPRPAVGCYAAAAGSFVVRPDGELAKCTLAMGHPANRVGKLRPDGTVELDSERMRPWLRGIYSEDQDELHCPALGLIFPPRPARPRVVARPVLT
jgi:uncharacterized protein